jgi:hypothetical protein
MSLPCAVAWVGLLDSVNYDIMMPVGCERQDVGMLWHSQTLRSCPPGKSALAGFWFGTGDAEM